MAVVVAQLAVRSLPTPEIRGSNPDISKNFMNIVNWIVEKTKINFKKAGKGPFFFKKKG